MKRLISLIFVIVFVLSSGIVTSAEGSLHWYIKRRRAQAPLFPKEADTISQYDAYYIDKEANERDEKIIYLTFDAGYENGNVEKILDILKEENVPAAFFLLDNIIRKNTDVVVRMAEEGHTVCNHTRNHKNLSGASEKEIMANLTALEQIYKDKTGREIEKYFRFPEGSYSIEALSIIQSLGYKTVFWSFAYDDWDNQRQPDLEKAKAKVLDGTHPGAVMLFHPTSDTNAAIMSDLIKSWREMGYSFGTLDRLTSK